MTKQSATADKPFAEATYREVVEALALQASMTCDGKLSPATHAQAAKRAADELIALQERRS